MAKLVAYDPDQHRAELRRLLTAYLEEGTVALRAAGIDEDVAATVDSDLAHTDQFQPTHDEALA